MKAKQRRRRKLAAKQARRYVSVRDHGAVGDASTDDRAAIQRAINVASRLGGVVFFPPGVYANEPSPRETFLADVVSMAGEIYDRAQAHIDAEAAKVRTSALEAVRDLLHQKMAPAALPAPRARREPTADPVAPPGGVEHPRQKNGKAPPSCRLCGKLGSNTKTCGKTADHPGPAATEAPPTIERVTPGMAASLGARATVAKLRAPSSIGGSARAALARTRAARAAEPADDDEEEISPDTDLGLLDDPAAPDDDDDDDRE